jgi:hypothetical protein
MAEIDERYKRGMIYTIRNIKDDTMIYVGSTINNLSKRFDNHKKCCKYSKSGMKLYSLIENNDWTDWYIELYEAYPCNNKKELNRREGEVIREIGTINKCIAGRTKKEYYKMNADIIKEDKKKYYEKNADIIKEKIKIHRVVNADKVKETRKKYYDKNADIIKENKKIFYEKNAEKISEKRNKEKVCCDICGAFIGKHYLTRHQKTKNCTDIASKK